MQIDLTGMERLTLEIALTDLIETLEQGEEPDRKWVLEIRALRQRFRNQNPN